MTNEFKFPLLHVFSEEIKQERATNKETLFSEEFIDYPWCGSPKSGFQVCTEKEVVYARSLRGYSWGFFEVSNDKHEEWLFFNTLNNGGAETLLIHRPSCKCVASWSAHKSRIHGTQVRFAEFLEPMFNLAVIEIIFLGSQIWEYRVLLSSARRKSLVQELDNIVSCLSPCLWSVIFDYLYLLLV